MTNVTKVVRPFFEKYVNRSMVESSILAGALFNVMPVSGQVSIDNSIINYLCQL
jgi:hypothetical protein